MQPKRLSSQFGDGCAVQTSLYIFFIYFLYSHKLIKGGINPLFALRLYAHLLGPGKKQVDKQINTGLLNIPVSIYANIISNP